MAHYITNQLIACGFRMEQKTVASIQWILVKPSCCVARLLSALGSTCSVCLIINADNSLRLLTRGGLRLQLCACMLTSQPALSSE